MHMGHLTTENGLAMYFSKISPVKASVVSQYSTIPTELPSSKATINPMGDPVFRVADYTNLQRTLQIYRQRHQV